MKYLKTVKMSAVDELSNVTVKFDRKNLPDDEIGDIQMMTENFIELLRKLHYSSTDVRNAVREVLENYDFED
ncbi:MAG TPA: hypothetical protein DC057_08670 [Spirochaetia bacterium]|nr:hypothetical protein [Spirochaetia bacterium]